MHICSGFEIGKNKAVLKSILHRVYFPLLVFRKTYSVATWKLLQRLAAPTALSSRSLDYYIRHSIIWLWYSVSLKYFPSHIAPDFEQDFLKYSNHPQIIIFIDTKNTLTNKTLCLDFLIAKSKQKMYVGPWKMTSPKLFCLYEWPSK